MVVMAVIVLVAMVVIMLMIMVVMVVFVVVMVIVMVVVVDDFLLAVDADGEMRRRDAAARDGLADKFDAGNAERVQLVECGLRVGLEFEKGGGEHVACGTH